MIGTRAVTWTARGSAVVGLALGLAGCVPGEAPADPDPSASASSMSAGPSLASPTQPTPGSSETNEPAQLVGLWVSEAEVDETAEIVYRFDSDGMYATVGILWQERRSGIFKYQVTARGTYTIEDETLVLSPMEGESTIEDPDAPESNGTRPLEDLAPETYLWTIGDTGASLTLTNEDGNAIGYLRERS